MRGLRRRKYFLASPAATPVALLPGLVPAGAGHGDYVLARLLFPCATPPAPLAGEAAAPPVALYGVAPDGADARACLPGAPALVAAAHAPAAVACFVFTGGDFS